MPRVLLGTRLQLSCGWYRFQRLIKRSVDCFGIRYSLGRCLSQWRPLPCGILHPPKAHLWRAQKIYVALAESPLTVEYILHPNTREGHLHMRHIALEMDCGGKRKASQYIGFCRGPSAPKFPLSLCP